MNLYATWDGERSSPSCVPRLFSATLQRLVLGREVAKDLSSVVIAAKLQGSKRVLRSNEIEVALPPCGPPEAELQLTISLQYPHALKRGASRLQLMVQRRRRYKQRTLRGYKTLAVGLIDMAEVLQHPVLQHPVEGARVLPLHRGLKDPALPVAEIRLNSLSSQPVDHEAKPKATDRSPDMDNYSEEEDESFSSEQEGSDDALPAQELFYEEEELRKVKKARRKLPASASARQPNIKQKFVALLKRFKVSDEVGVSPPHPTPWVPAGAPMGAVGQVSRARMRAVAEDLDELYDTLDLLNGSDSGAEPDDTDSVRSTPKPRLRPFFEGLSQSSSRTELGALGRDGAGSSTQGGTAEVGAPHKGGGRPPEDGGQDPEVLEAGGDPEPPLEPGGVPEKLKTPLRGSRGEAASPTQGGAPPRERQHPGVPGERRGSSDLERSPELPAGTHFVARLLRREQKGPLVAAATGAELQGALGALLARIQRYCRCNAAAPPPVRLVLVGAQGAQSHLLRGLVRLLGTRGPAWLRYLRVLPVPLGPQAVAQHLGALDGRYGAAFLEPAWRELFGRSEAPATEPFDVVGRIMGYVAGASVTHQLPVAEAMLTCQHKFRDEGSYQKFVPFVGVVKVGLGEDPPPAAGDGDEGPALSLAVPSTSPPGGPGVLRDAGATPPSSPSMAAANTGGDALGLQVDFWVAPGGAAGGPAQGPPRERAAPPKSSLRGSFRSLAVTRLPPPGEAPGATLALSVVTTGKSRRGEGAPMGDTLGTGGATLALSVVTTGKSRRGEGAPMGDTLGTGGATLALSVVTTGKSRRGEGAPMGDTLGTGGATLALSVVTTGKSRRGEGAPMGDTLGTGGATLALSVVTMGKSRRGPGLFLGKRPREPAPDGKSLVVEGINRLICWSRHPRGLLRVTVDGVEWDDVKFFQLAAQWPTHVKYLPVGLFGEQPP
ncbi:LOW QUALITY PROTEIN: phosphofurin acidic cluster sorting protein 1 [Eudromia elegans]